MALSEKLSELLTAPRRHHCSVCEWYKTLSKEEKKLFDSCAADNGVTKRALWASCHENGMTVALSTFRDHLRNHHGAV